MVAATPVARKRLRNVRGYSAAQRVFGTARFRLPGELDEMRFGLAEHAAADVDGRTCRRFTRPTCP